LDSYVEKESLKSMGIPVLTELFKAPNLPEEPLVIALMGRKRCGKTAAAKYLTRTYPFLGCKFASVLKNMLLAMGLSTEDIEGRTKETPKDILCGKTPRYAMQTLGTEWGRELIGENLWTGLWKRKVRKYLTRGYFVVCDDLRFPNEAQAVREMGGIVVRLIGKEDDISKLDGHASEANYDGISADYTINNCGTIAELYSKLNELLAHIRTERDTGSDHCA
jgi:hypothetical protein